MLQRPNPELVPDFTRISQMRTRVFAHIQEFKILDAVVSLVAVQMVDMLIRIKQPTQRILHHQSVLKNAASIRARMFGRPGQQVPAGRCDTFLARAATCLRLTLQPALPRTMFVATLTRAPSCNQIVLAASQTGLFNRSSQQPVVLLSLFRPLAHGATLYKKVWAVK